MSTVPEPLEDGHGPLGDAAEYGEEIAAGEPHLRVVERRARFQPRLALWLGSIISVGALFMLVAFNVFMVQGQFRLDRITQQRAIEQNAYEHLRAEVAERDAPETILAKASRLGLVPASQVHYILDAPLAAPKKTQAEKASTTPYSSVKPHFAPSP